MGKTSRLSERAFRNIRQLASPAFGKVDKMERQISGKYYLISTLHSFSQVILLANWKTGLFIFLGILVVSWQFAVVSLLSVIIANIIGYVLTKNGSFIEDGLMGYNSVLTCLAILIFLEGPYLWLLAFAGAGLSALATVALNNYFVRIPVLTFPFIITSWLIFLFPYKLDLFTMSDQLVPQNLMHWEYIEGSGMDWITAFFKSISEIFLLDSVWAGALILAGILIAGIRVSASTILSAVAALAFAYILGAENDQMQLGLYGYNAILTAIAVGHTFNVKGSKGMFVYGLIGALLTVPISASLSILLVPYGLPVLTIPFVIITWLLLSASNSILKPGNRV